MSAHALLRGFQFIQEFTRSLALALSRLALSRFACLGGRVAVQGSWLFIVFFFLLLLVVLCS